MCGTAVRASSSTTVSPDTPRYLSSLPQHRAMQLQTRAKITRFHRRRCWADIWVQVERVVATGAGVGHRLLWPSLARVHNSERPLGGRRPVHG